MKEQSIISLFTQTGARIAVLGLGISGVEAAKFLLRRGCYPICFDGQSEERFRSRSGLVGEIEKLKQSGATVVFGVEESEIMAHVSGIVGAVISPGVPLNGYMAQCFASLGIPVIGEFELGIALSGIPSVVVTGSNGKSTTVSLLHAVWAEEGKRSLLCGNVGVPVIASADAGGKFDVLVGEASSYQLESCSILCPDVGIFLNLSENHLERHGTMEGYLAAKLRLFGQHDSSKIAVLNYDDPLVRSASSAIESSIVWFGREINCDAQGVIIEYDRDRGLDRLQYRIGEDNGFVDLTGSQLVGLHHRYNAAAALAAFLSMKGDPKSFERAVRSFAGLPHRTAIVGRRGASFVINDSKSTTPAATEAALLSVGAEYPHHAITLLIGGSVKAGSWGSVFGSILKEQGRREVRIVCFGKDGSKLQQDGADFGVPSFYYSTVAEAVAALPDLSDSREIILFSPGAASFDEFRDFEDRGERFSKLILDRFQFNPTAI
jgi:UDP-N-acetylmuramoylalanine--D-glutamate ligase